MSHRTDVLASRPAREWLWMGAAVLFSMVVHVTGALSAASIEPSVPAPEEVWVEMVLQVDEPPAPEIEPEPLPPEPEPEVVPEPPPVPVPAVPEKVDFQPPPPEPPSPTPPPPPDAKPTPRAIQGLSNDSFLEGGSTGLAVNHGNTTGTKATDTLLALDETPGAFVPIPYTSVSQPPKVKWKPKLEVPKSVQDAGLEGRVELLLTIDAEGRVTAVTIVSAFHPEAGQACADAMRKSRWKAGAKDGRAVITQGVPSTCRVEMAVD